MNLDTYIGVILDRCWIVIALAVLLMLVLAAGARFIVVTNDYRILFKDDNPELLAYNALKDIYAASDQALIAVAPQDQSVFTRQTLGAIEELTEAAWLVPYSTRVDSLTNFFYSEAHDEDLIVEPLAEDAHSLDDAELHRIESIATAEIDIVNRFVSSQGHVGAVLITFALPEDRDAAVTEITDRLDHLLTEYRGNHPQIDFYLTGDVVVNRAFSDATQDDLRTLTPIVFGFIVIFAIVLLRSIWGTVAIVVVMNFSVISTMGLIGWADAVLSPTNSGIPIIVMVIAVAHSIHIIATTLSGMKKGLDKRSAIAESIRINSYPVFLTSLTTAIGFLSLNASETPPFHVLGNFAAFGVLCIFIYSMTFLPALLSVLPFRVRPGRSIQHEFFDRLSEFVIARRHYLLWSVAAFTIILISGIPRIELSDNFTKYFDDQYEFRRDTDFIIGNLTGMESLEYSLESGRENGITDPEYLRKLDAFAEWFRQQPEVITVVAFSDVMKRLNKNLHHDDVEFYRIPDDSELAAQYLLLYELSLPFGQDLNDRIDVSKSSTRMSVVLKNLTSRNQRELDERAQIWLQGNAPDMASPATGFSIIVAHLSERNIHGMLRGTITAMLLISIILIVVFKSVRMGIISLIPNFVPAAMSFGLWGYLVGNVSMAASVVTAIAFGIVVDDTIHFLSKYLRYRRAGQLPADAIRATFRTVGHALWTTTAVLAVGFLVFTVSGFEISWALGYLVSMTLIFALIADFLLLPPLLLAIDKAKNVK